MRLVGLLPLLLAPALAAGCHDPITEVVMLITGDVLGATAGNVIEVEVQPGTVPPMTFGGSREFKELPLSVGFTSGGHTSVFSLTVAIFRGFSTNALLVRRSVTAVSFVPEQKQMFELPLKMACACDGTSCPNPGTNPDCDDLIDPELAPFDPARVPPPGMGPVMQVFDNSGFPGGFKGL